MRRTLTLLATLALVLGVGACGDDDDDTATVDETTTTTEAEAESEDETTTTAAEAPAGDATVGIGDTDLGEVLVDADGRTLYLFMPDSMETSACTDDCVSAWPPLMLADGEPVAGVGVDQALLSLAPRTDGDDQVAYNGHRLYTYAGDSAPGDTTGHGVGDVWFAVSPAGEAVPA